jgi:hypothetical protein
MQQTDKSITNPLEDAEKVATETAAVTKWRAGQTLNDVEKQAIISGTTVPHSSSLPIGAQIQGIYDARPDGLFVVGDQLYTLSKRKPEGADHTYDYATSADGEYMVFFDGRWEPADQATGKRVADLNRGPGMDLVDNFR